MIVTVMPDGTPILAHVDRTSGEVEEMPLMFCKLAVVPEETIPRRQLRAIYRSMGAPAAEELMGPWEDEDELDRRWAMIQTGQVRS